MRKIVTINDVAAEAKVSVATVSRVLNGYDRVSPTTKKKVLSVVKKLNYTPNSFAVSMIKKKSNMIAVVVPDLLNPFYTAVVRGVESEVKKQGYSTFVYSTNDEAEEEGKLLHGPLHKNVDGIILIGAQKEMANYNELPNKVVLVDRYLEGSQLDGVVIDNYGGAFDAVSYGIALNHQKIAIINGPCSYNDGRDRLKGYQDALIKHQIPLREEYHVQGTWYEENGYKGVKKLIALSDPPSLIFATNNLICEGALLALRDLKLTIGKDISLIGFDENKLSQYVRPEITVVKRPTFEMGTVAAQLLLEKLVDDSRESVQKITLSVEVIKRGSVKKINLDGEKK